MIGRWISSTSESSGWRGWFASVAREQTQTPCSLSALADGVSVRSALPDPPSNKTYARAEGKSRKITRSDQKSAETRVLSVQNSYSFSHDGAIRSACFSPDGTHVISASLDATSHLCGIDAGKWCSKMIIRHTDVLTSAKFRQDSTRLITTSRNGEVKIYGLSDGHWLKQFDAKHDDRLIDAKVSPDGVHVALQRWGGVTFWASKTGSGATNTLLLSLPRFTALSSVPTAVIWLLVLRTVLAESLFKSMGAGVSKTEFRTLIWCQQ